MSNWDYAQKVPTEKWRSAMTLPRELSNIVLTCTGSESVDLALRIARAVTGGTGFIATANAYHGNTLAVSFGEDTFEQRGLAAAQKTGKDGDRNQAHSTSVAPC